MAFRIGQKVVCIDAGAGDTSGRRLLTKGSIYRVKAVGKTSKGTPGLIVDLPVPNGFWRQDRFRPIAERKTDISIFTRMLNAQHIHKADPPLVG